jgi:segregation and condensation protein B
MVSEKTINEIDEARLKSKISSKPSISSSKTIGEIDDLREKENVKLLEAVFFVSGRFLNMQELVSLTDLNPIIINDLLDRLKERYNGDSAIEIVETPKGVPRDISSEMSTRGKTVMWKMDVRQEYVHIINKLATGSAEFTKAEQETLAIIAFKQPIKQSVIIKIRGNKAYEHIKKFADLSLIKKKKMGHTNELSLSDDFYDYFSVAEGSGNVLKDVEAEIERAEKEVEEEEKDK